MPSLQLLPRLPTDVLISVLDRLTAEAHHHETNTGNSPTSSATSTTTRRGTKNVSPAQLARSARLALLLGAGPQHPDLIAHSHSIANRSLALHLPPFRTSPASSPIDTAQADAASERLMVIGYTTQLDPHNPIDHAFEAYRSEAALPGEQFQPWSARSWGNDHAWVSFFRRLGGIAPTDHDARDEVLERTVLRYWGFTTLPRPSSDDWTPLIVWCAYCGYTKTLQRVLALLDDPRAVLASFRGRHPLLSAIWTSSFECLRIIGTYLKLYNLLDMAMASRSGVAYRLRGHWKYRRWHLARITPFGAALLLGLERPLMDLFAECGDGQDDDHHLSHSYSYSHDLSAEDPELSSLFTPRGSSSSSSSLMMPLPHAAIESNTLPGLAIALAHPRSDLHGPLVRHNGELPFALAVRKRRAHEVAALLADPRMESVKGELGMKVDVTGLGDAEVVAKLVMGWLG